MISKALPYSSLEFSDFSINFGRHDRAVQYDSRRECGVELDAEPTAELGGIGQRAPYSLRGARSSTVFLDTVGIHERSPWFAMSNLLVAYYRKPDGKATIRLRFRKAV